MRYRTRLHLAAEARLDSLSRHDKWFLSAGDGTLWAPPFPLWLHRPGFWDPGHVYHYPIGPIFSVALLDDAGVADPLLPLGLDWRPDRLVVRWESRSGLALTEARYVLPGGRFCSAWRTEEELGWPNPVFKGRWLAAFTAPRGDAVRHLCAEGSGEADITWVQTLTDRRGQTLECDVCLGASLLPPRGHIDTPPAAAEPPAGAHRDAIRSEGQAHPEWDRTPFVERWPTRPIAAHRPAGTSGVPHGVPTRDVVHMVLAVPLEGLPTRHGVAFVLRALPRLEESAGAQSGQAEQEAALPGRTQRRKQNPHPCDETPRPRLSAAGWERAFTSFPRLRCSDPYMARYFDYRVYGLHLNRLQGGLGRIRHPAVAEGIEYFHLPITYSAQCHMWETRWCLDPSTARGSLLNFLENQRDDGSLPGRLYVNHAVGEDFYHANWGDAVLAVHALHPDAGFLGTAYEGLARYARWLLRERDPEGSGMITVVNHFETGQEYMSRYLAVDPESDVNEWEPRLRLKGVDVTVYAHQLLRALASMAQELGRAKEADEWTASARVTAGAIQDQMWDEAEGIFSDVDGATRLRTGVKSSVCFYPLLTELLSDAQVDALLAHLVDPAEFGTPYPVPSSSVDDPFFSAEGLWKGKRQNCPWNGRAWPMTNSHVIEGLIRQWQAGRRAAGPVAAQILERFVHMMFHDGDLGRANCYEHYNPETGHACTFRGIDDYQHSWVLDLLARGAAGVQPQQAMIRFDPLPLGLDHLRFQATVRGMELDVQIEGDDLRVDLAGQEHVGVLGSPLEIPW